MLDALVITWAKKYYGPCIGLKEPDSFGDESAINTEFLNAFKLPIYKFLGLRPNDALEPKHIVYFNTEFKNAKLYGDYRVLEIIANNYCDSSLPWPNNLEKAVEKFKDEMVPCAAVLPKGKSFATYRTADGVMLTDPNAVYLGDLSKFKGRVPNIKELSQVNPTTITDFQIDALRAAVNGGVLKASDLAKTLYEVPDLDKGEFVTEPVDAMDTRLPKFYVRRFVNNLPEALKASCPSQYEAALSYAESAELSSADQSTVNQIRNIVKSIRKASTQKPAEPDYVPTEESANTETNLIDQLNDDIVMEYLNKRFGIPFCELSEVVNPTEKTLYSSSLLLDSNKDMSAKDFLDAVNSGEASAADTLDEVIKAYCRQNDIDLECTIAQLIHHIGFECTITPMTFEERCAQYIKETNCPPEMTVQCIADGTEPTPVKTKSPVDAIRECDDIDDNAKDGIIAALEGKGQFIIPDLMEICSNMHLPDALLTALATAEQTHSEFVMPTVAPTEDSVVDYITQHGIPRAYAQSIASGTMPDVVPTSDSVKDALIKAGFEAAIADKLLTGQLPETQSEFEKFAKDSGITSVQQLQDLINKKTVSDSYDVGYRVGEYILNKTRSTLAANDSMDVRNGLVPICYAFVRLMMVPNSERGTLPEFLKSVKDKCSGPGAEIMEEAIHLL